MSFQVLFLLVAVLKNLKPTEQYAQNHTVDGRNFAPPGMYYVVSHESISIRGIQPIAI